MVKQSAKGRARGGGRGVRAGRGAWSPSKAAPGESTDESGFRRAMGLVARVSDESALPRAHALLDRLSLRDLHAVIPVLEKHDLLKASGTPLWPERTGEMHPPVPFSTFAEHLETLEDMLNGCGPLETLNCAELAAFIRNHGTKEEAAEMMLTLLSVGGPVFRRWDSAAEASLAKSRAAVTGKKVGKGGASNGA